VTVHLRSWRADQPVVHPRQVFFFWNDVAEDNILLHGNLEESSRLPIWGNLDIGFSGNGPQLDGQACGSQRFSEWSFTAPAKAITSLPC
jgi:hypothetical protein